MSETGKSSFYQRLLFWTAASFTMVMALVPHPPHVPGEPSDKVQHIIAFATLATLAAWAYRRTSPISIVVGLSLFGALIEVLQAIPMLHRDSEVLDWMADTLACAFVLAVIHWRRSQS